jgi:hypothetical protein
MRRSRVDSVQRTTPGETQGCGGARRGFRGQHETSISCNSSGLDLIAALAKLEFQTGVSEDQMQQMFDAIYTAGSVEDSKGAAVGRHATALHRSNDYGHSRNRRPLQESTKAEHGKPVTQRRWRLLQRRPADGAEFKRMQGGRRRVRRSGCSSRAVANTGTADSHIADTATGDQR